MAEQLSNPNLQPVTQLPEEIVVQEQLFDGHAYDQQVLEDRKLQAESVLGAIDVSDAEKKVQLTKPLTAEADLATRDALAIINKPDAELPEALSVKRDWSDSLADHTEKQNGLKDAAAKVLEARLAAHEKVSASRQRSAEKRQAATDQKALEESRQTKTAAAKSAREADSAKRAELRAEFIAKERLMRGENMAKLFGKEIAIAADKHVRSTMHPETKPPTGNSLDTQKLKDEKYNKLSAAEQIRQETSAALKDFQTGFAEVSPNRVAAAEQSQSNERLIQFRPRQDGNVQLGFEVENQGATLQFATNEHTKNSEDRKIIITDTEGNQFYVRNEYMYQIRTNNSGEPVVITSDHIDDELHDVTIGQKWSVDNDRATLLDIDCVEVATGLADADTNLSAYESNGEDPFELADALIDQLPEVEESGDVLMQERPKQVMAWAARQLKRLKKAPLAAAVVVQNGVNSAKEYFTDEEKGSKRKTIAGAVLGAIVLGGIAYLELKGSGVSQHAQDRPRGGTGPSEIQHSGTTPSVEHAPKHLPKHETLHTTKLGHGDTIWDKASEQLQREHKPTDPKHVLERTQHILRLNDLNWEQARHLAEGTEIKLSK